VKPLPDVRTLQTKLSWCGLFQRVEVVTAVPSLLERTIRATFVLRREFPQLDRAARSSIARRVLSESGVAN
jgi:hypothetical protein